LDHKEADIKVKAANITRMYSIGTMEPEEVEVAADSFKLQRAAIAADRARLMAANAHYRLSEGMDWRLAMYGGLNARTLQNLLRSVLNRVEIFGYHVRVTFKGGTGFTLPRQVAGNRRTFPLPMVSWVEGSAEPPKIRYLYEDVKPTEVHTFKNITIEVCGQPTKPQARGERAKLPWFKDAYNLPLAEGSPDRL
jgi:hypothetical protein